MGNPNLRQERSENLLEAFKEASAFDSLLLDKLRVKAIEKFVVFQIPLQLAKQRYGTHFAVAANDLHETADLRVLDFDVHHAFRLFHFDELGQPRLHEGA
jgi:hypothetical protein